MRLNSLNTRTLERRPTSTGLTSRPAAGPLDLVGLVLDSGENVLEAFDLAEPAALMGFVEPFDEAVAGAV